MLVYQRVGVHNSIPVPSFLQAPGRNEDCSLASWSAIERDNENASGEKTGLASPKTGDAHVLPHPIKEESIEKHIKSVK